jgi:hypothetical protein
MSVLAAQGETRPALPTSHRLPLLAFTAKEVSSAAATATAPAAPAPAPSATAATVAFINAIVLQQHPAGTVYCRHRVVQASRNPHAKHAVQLLNHG